MIAPNLKTLLTEAQTLEVIEGGLLIAQQLFSSTISEKETSDVLQELTLTLAQVAKATFEALSQGNAEQDEHFLTRIEILHRWAKLLSSLLEKLQTRRYYGLSFIIYSDDFARLFYTLLMLNVPLDKESLLVDTENERLTSLLHRMKLRALEALNVIGKYIFTRLADQQRPDQDQPTGDQIAIAERG